VNVDPKHLMDSGRWFYIQIYERDETPARSFVGKRIAEADGNGLYRDQDGDWFLVYDESISYGGGCGGMDEVTIASESVDQGRTFDELVANMRDWINQVCDGVVPTVLCTFDRESIHEIVGYDS
jgi:hypothetical protein